MWCWSFTVFVNSSKRVSSPTPCLCSCCYIRRFLVSDAKPLPLKRRDWLEFGSGTLEVGHIKSAILCDLTLYLIQSCTLKPHIDNIRVASSWQEPGGVGIWGRGVNQMFYVTCRENLGLISFFSRTHRKHYGKATEFMAMPRERWHQFQEVM